MGKLIDLMGQRFDRLMVIKRVDNDKWGQARWLCQCDCGQMLTVVGNDLRRHHTQSCGCLSREQKKRHGLCASLIYCTWENMIQRCTNFKAINYKNYGGRGIKVCKRWLKFENFLEDMGERPLGKTIDRIDNNQGYHKMNCRWATVQEQNKNKRSTK